MKSSCSGNSRGSAMGRFVGTELSIAVAGFGLAIRGSCLLHTPPASGSPFQPRVTRLTTAHFKHAGRSTGRDRRGGGIRHRHRHRTHVGAFFISPWHADHSARCTAPADPAGRAQPAKAQRGPIPPSDRSLRSVWRFALSIVAASRDSTYGAGLLGGAACCSASVTAPPGRRDRVARPPARSHRRASWTARGTAAA